MTGPTDHAGSAEPVGDTVILPVATAGETVRHIGAGLRRHPVRSSSVLLLCVVAAVAGVVPLLALGVLVDRVTEHAAVSTLIPIAAVAGVAALVGGLAAGATMHSVAHLGADLLADTREAAVTSALHMRRDLLEDAGRGDLLSRVSNDVTAVNRAATTVLPTVVTAVALAAVTLVAMLGLDWRLGLAGALAVPFYVVALRWYLPRSGPVYAAERRAAAERSHALVETIGGRDTVHAYAAEAWALEEVDRTSGRTRDLAMAAFTLFTRLVGRVNRAEFAGLAAILVVGYWAVSSGATTVGATTAAALMFHRLFNPIGMILYSAADLQLAAAGLARLIGVTQADGGPAHRTSTAGADTPADLTLDDVAFSYRAGRPVLRGVDLHVPAGRSLALVGASGAGKSTVAGIVGGTLVPDAGRVVVGGDHAVYTVSQEVHVFAGPLIDDLRLAAPEASAAEVEKALGRVGASDWVHALPDGVDTGVGDGGHQLTDAQAQQVALARLLLADPQVVVLDEATAEAGSHHAAELEEAAEVAIAGRTAVIIAHRLSQIRSADAVAVLEAGTVIEYGTPDELIAAGGHLSRLWTAWAGPSASDGESARGAVSHTHRLPPHRQPPPPDDHPEDHR